MRMDMDSKLSDNLRAIMAVQGLTIAEVSTKTGVSRQTITGMIGDQRVNPSLDVLQKLARGLHVRLAALIGEPDPDLRREDLRDLLREALLRVEDPA